MAGGRVSDKQGFTGLKVDGDAFQFFDEVLIDFLTAGGVENDGGGILGFEPFDGAFGGFEDVFFPWFWDEDGDLDFVGQHLQLLNGGGAVEVEGHERRPLAFFFQPTGEFGAGGGFARSIQAADEDVSWSGEVQRGGVSAEQSAQFIVENLDDLLAGRDGLEDLIAESADFHGLDKRLGHTQFHVGFQQGHAHVTHRLNHVAFSDFPEAP